MFSFCNGFAVYTFRAATNEVQIGKTVIDGGTLNVFRLPDGIINLFGKEIKSEKMKRLISQGIAVTTVEDIQ